MKAKDESIEEFKRNVYETQNDIPSNIKCQVCLRYAYTPDDQIILCNFCNGAVHQKCYGSPIESKMPEGFDKFLSKKFICFISR